VKAKSLFPLLIITSGFQAAFYDLETAIDEARNARVLIFAAASNYGNMQDIAFPARPYVDLKVFCMFSTDPNVRAYPHSNPSPIADARQNFAILGDEIVLPGSEQSLSGTSFRSYDWRCFRGALDRSFSAQGYAREHKMC
jgi:hypothetical protein